MNETTGSSSWETIANLLNSVPTMPASATVTVNHDNVLAAAKIIQAQIDALNDVFTMNAPNLRIDNSAEDPVSKDAARAWNHRLLGADDSYAARISEYLDSLHKVLNQLRDSAKTYGFNDQDIAASFGTTVV
jgi:hypothetical protein